MRCPEKENAPRSKEEVEAWSLLMAGQRQLRLSNGGMVIGLDLAGILALAGSQAITKNLEQVTDLIIACEDVIARELNAHHEQQADLHNQT